jgi:tRNA U34 5-carboxymethylaminomethyl modifying GTPase MnmE/TrmE
MAGILKFLLPKRVPREATGTDPAGSAVAINPGDLAGNPSALLRDVLGSASSQGEGGHGEQADRRPLSQRLDVGSVLSNALRRTIDAAAELGPLVGIEEDGILQSATKTLSESVCRIAFVGQMNAGKSSLINVLVEDPDLLPADINPWTTVVTHLHFGVPGTPVSGATFTFFDEAEWQRLSSGGRTREVTERVFPDFDWATLESQVAGMQARAARKLGPRLQELLGTEHDNPAVTPGLLNRYVGAGLDHGEFLPGAEGEYSDITKVAKVFFDLGAFNFPTILIDTPGVNDPLLVRDEITRQSLEAADICVVVLTARQPLSAADLNLLRVLRGLNKSRLIIFVNKIDEIEGDGNVLREVSERVSAVLKQEFPDADVPVVLGSALWAKRSLSRGVETSSDPADGQGVSEPPALLDLPNQDEVVQTAAAEIYLRKSGLRALVIAISELTEAGPVAENLAKTNALIERICRNTIASCEAELELLAAKLLSGDRVDAGWEPLVSEIRRAFDQYAEAMEQFYNECVSAIFQKLSELVVAHAQELIAENPQAEWMDVLQHADLRLRLKLESVFIDEVDRLSEGLRSVQDALSSNLFVLLADSVFAGRLDLAVGARAMPKPSLAALSEPVALEFTLGIVDGQSKNLSSDERLDYLRRLLVSDFEPIATQLAREAGRVLRQAVSALMNESMSQILRPIEASDERLRTLSQQIAADEADAGRKLTQAMDDSHRRIAALRRVREILQPATPSPPFLSGSREENPLSR